MSFDLKPEFTNGKDHQPNQTEEQEKSKFIFLLIIRKKKKIQARSGRKSFRVYHLWQVLFKSTRAK